MNEQQQYFIDLPQQQIQEDEPLFDVCNLPQVYRLQKIKYDFGNVEEDNEVIDQELLKMTSELHEALRNKKLLQFQLLESQIMKKNNMIQCQKLEERLNQMPQIKQRLKQQNREDKYEIKELDQQIENQRRKNAQLVTKIAQANQRIVKNKQTLKNLKEQITQQIPKGDKVNSHGYISVEKMRLEGENRSKKQVIEEIKKMMTEVKENIAKKQRVNEELEAQYQELMAEVQKVQKNNKRKKIKSEAACSLVPTDREENRADQTDRSQIQKQNKMNSMNFTPQIHHKSIEIMKKFKSNGSNLVQADWSKKDNSKLKKKKGGINDSKSLVRRVY